MISRYFIVALALGLTIYRLSQGAWVAAAGLAGLAGGLTVLELARSRPALKPLAWACFVVTVVSMVWVYLHLPASS